MSFIMAFLMMLNPQTYFLISFLQLIKHLGKSLLQFLWFEINHLSYMLKSKLNGANNVRATCSIWSAQFSVLRMTEWRVRKSVTSPSTRPGHWVGNSLPLSATYCFALRHWRSTSTLLFQAFSVKTRSESITESDTTESSSLSLSGHPQTHIPCIPTRCEPIDHRPGRLASKKSQ